MNKLYTFLLGILVLTFSSCDNAGEVSSLPSLELIYNADENPTEKNLLAQWIQSELADTGIQVKLLPLPTTEFYERTNEGRFQAALNLWYLDYNDPEGFLTDFYSKSSYRFSKYNNPQFDSLYLAFLFSNSAQKRIELLLKTKALVEKDLPWIPLFSNQDLFLIMPGYEAFQSNAFQYYEYRGIHQPEVHASIDIDVQTFDPAMTYDLGSKHMVTQMYEGLVKLDENNSLMPHLASSYFFNKTYDTLDLILRDDVFFHQSSFLKQPRELSAEDVKFSFERLTKLGSPYGYIFDHVIGIEEFRDNKIDHIAGIQILESKKIRILLQKPFPSMINWLLAPAAYIVPSGLPKDFDFTKESCGTGPYVLSSWDGEKASFINHQGYWLDSLSKENSPQKKLTVAVIKDSNREMAAFRNGEINILNLRIPHFPIVFDEAGNLKDEWKSFSLRATPLDNLKFIGFNMMDSVWGGEQSSLRQLVSDRLNRAKLVKQVLHGKGTGQKTIIPSGMKLE